MGNLLRKPRRFTNVRYKNEIDRIYEIVNKRLDEWDFSIYVNTSFDYNFILKQVQKKFWFTNIYYYDTGIVTNGDIILDIRRIVIQPESRFCCF